MFGLIVLGALGIYLLVLIAVTWFAYHCAAKNGLSFGKRLLAAAAGFLIIYLPVFWDHIPTIIAHDYYCEKEAGFWVYKSKEQWVIENVDAAKSLEHLGPVRSSREGDVNNHIVTYELNQRLNWVVKNSGPHLLNRWKREDEIIDAKNGDVLVRNIDFSTSQILPKAGWAGWKMWLYAEHCAAGAINRRKMLSIESEFENIGKGNGQ